MLVRIRNVAPARHQAGQRRIGQSERIIYQVAKNKPVELLGRGADGRNRLTVSVGKSSRMTLLMMTWLIKTWLIKTWLIKTWLIKTWLMQRSGRDRRRAASTGS
jgi:hypothetical protein